jgi:hypothetical protein
VFTSSDLDFLCQFGKKVSDIRLKDLHFKLHEIPNSCVNVTKFTITNERNKYAELNYSWPLFWSTSNTIKDIEINIAGINVSNIKKPNQVFSVIRAVVFHGNTFHQKMITLPSFFFDGSLPSLAVFECRKCLFPNGTKFPIVSESSQLKQLRLDYLSRSFSHTGRINNLVLKNKHLQSLRINNGAIVDINLATEFLNQLYCLDLTQTLINPLNTTQIFNVKGEIRIQKESANLDKLLAKETNNISVIQSNEGISTKWRVNNMICELKSGSPGVTHCSSVLMDGNNATNSSYYTYNTFCNEDYWVNELTKDLYIYL